MNTIIEKIRAEVEYRRDLNYKYYVKQGRCSSAEYRYDEDVAILSILSCLEKSVKHDFQDVPAKKNCHEDEINEMLAKIDAETLSQLRDMEKSEKPMNQDELEEEIERYIPTSLAVKFPTTDIETIKSDIRYIARHFAQWQMGKDLSSINKSYESGVVFGMNAQKEQMMKEAVEGILFEYRGILMAKATVPHPERFKPEDVDVKLIVIKEDTK